MVLDIVLYFIVHLRNHVVNAVRYINFALR